MTTSALERCVGDPRRFVEEHWGRAPLLHRGDPEGVAGLLDLGDVDHLVTETLLRMPGFRLVRDGEPLDPSTYTGTVRIGGRPLERTVRPDLVLSAFDRGATIVLQALHRQSGPVARFCRDLELALTHPVQANAYVTPPTSRGFDVHHDTHDVFVVQTHGRKSWRVYRPLVELAGPEQPWSESLGEPGSPVLEAELRPGDVLYIPRGFPHDAEARREVSVHVTVGITATTWVDAWRRVMRRVSEHRGFRDALPPGWASEPSSAAEELDVRRKELVEWLAAEVDEELLRGLARSFWSSRRPLLSGHLSQLGWVDAVDETTALRRRPGSVFVVEARDGRATVLLGMRELRMPGFCEAALRFVADREDRFVPADLPGLDQDSAVVLARRLVREGALEVAGADD
ncbi:MAG TPA: cupin domain-containing protein [Actinomycetota bacterium]|nr:cupin domain-containing protein [Actinomycetota bacterium]